jgi:hypothetical protein
MEMTIEYAARMRDRLERIGAKVTAVLRDGAYTVRVSGGQFPDIHAEGDDLIATLIDVVTRAECVLELVEKQDAKMIVLQKEMKRLIGLYSERVHCAGWYVDVEYDVFRDMMSEHEDRQLLDEERRELRRLFVTTQSWLTWPSGVSEAYWISADEWHKKHSLWCARHAMRILKDLVDRVHGGLNIERAFDEARLIIDRYT